MKKQTFIPHAFIACYITFFILQFKGLMHVSGRPVGSFDNEGLIFAAGVDAEVIRLYDLRSFDKVYLDSFIVLQLKF